MDILFSAAAFDWLFVSLYVCQPNKIHWLLVPFFAEFLCLSALFFFLVTHNVTFYRADTQTNKMKLALTNSSHLFVFCHKNIILFWLIKLRKVTKVKQTLQISNCKVIFAMCLSWMTVVNRAHDYKSKYLRTRLIIRWLGKPSSADIIANKNQFSSDATEPKRIFICNKIFIVTRE